MNTLPHSVIKGVLGILKDHSSTDIAVQNFVPASGGCINQGGELYTSAGSFFVKWNYTQKYPGMFSAEAIGLKLLAVAHAIRIPQVIGVADCEDYQIILMEFISPGPRKKDFWKYAGYQLAELHKKRSNQFGLEQSNYMGSLPQYNNFNPSWIAFFIQNRLEPQVKLGVDIQAISPAVAKDFELLYNKLPDILALESPSLVHGDLWKGNLLVDDQGNPCLIDPAAYYGHREVDLAMTQLFGGFDRLFYESYNDHFPLEKGFQQRMDIYNLYPLLVHVNLFGQSYLSQVQSILKAYI